MKDARFKPLIIIFLLACAIVSRAQSYSNNLEFNIYDFPWFNVHPTPDTAFGTENQVSRCDNLIEFGLGFEYPIPPSLYGKNLRLSYEADFRFPDTVGNGEIVFTIMRDNNTLYWQNYSLSQYANDSAQWFHASIETDFPADYLQRGILKSFLWNPNKSLIFIDNIAIEFHSFTMPGFLPETPAAWDSLRFLVTEYLIEQDTLVEYSRLEPHPQGYLAQYSIGSTQIHVTHDTSTHEKQYAIQSDFNQECRLLRQALALPYYDSTLVVYRKNHKIDTTLIQPEYYLDREGFTIGQGANAISCYHPTGISSMQLDTKDKRIYFNLDYWRDHPMIHYPLSDTLEDVFEDISCREIQAGDTWNTAFALSEGLPVKTLPRILPIPGGYESGIIFTEHADWTDIRTHRAVCFGHEDITLAREAIGGFVFYGIPVTKSVFYNNPDGITNEEASHGTFPGLQATVKTDKEFEDLLTQLDKLGFEICLHTPEQYTTNPSNLEEALDYMRRHFRSASWIDHGYNNGSRHNREDLVCDGLRPDSPVFAGQLWEKNHIQYLWNAYYEENRMEDWCFDNNLMQPYPGFSDALPNRQVTTLPSSSQTSTPDFHPSTFLAWSTPSTLDANTDNAWDFYYHPNRLMRIVENHDVHITHVYPAWTNPSRAFWTYDDNGDIVALPGMNRALDRIAKLKAERKMLPMTVRTYLDHYAALLQVEYHILDSNTILLVNKGSKIDGLTLLCDRPCYPENKFYDFKKTVDGYMLWFDIGNHESVTIKIR